MDYPGHFRVWYHRGYLCATGQFLGSALDPVTRAIAGWGDSRQFRPFGPWQLDLKPCGRENLSRRKKLKTVKTVVDQSRANVAWLGGAGRRVDRAIMVVASESQIGLVAAENRVERSVNCFQQLCRNLWTPRLQHAGTVNYFTKHRFTSLISNYLTADKHFV
jgi:hypothetical protein